MEDAEVEQKIDLLHHAISRLIIDRQKMNKKTVENLPNQYWDRSLISEDNLSKDVMRQKIR